MQKFPAPKAACGIGFGKQQNTNDEHDNQCANANVLTSAGLRDDGNQRCSHKRSAFAADVKKPKILSGFFWRNYLAKIGTGKGLNSTLEHTDTYSQNPELPLVGQENGKNGNAGIGDNANFN